MSEFAYVCVCVLACMCVSVYVCACVRASATFCTYSSCVQYLGPVPVCISILTNVHSRFSSYVNLKQNHKPVNFSPILRQYSQHFIVIPNRPSACPNNSHPAGNLFFHNLKKAKPYFYFSQPQDQPAERFPPRYEQNQPRFPMQSPFIARHTMAHVCTV